ncbi:hypothetical protein PPROV_000547400 [Pycnococcus provasolii]|uniref:Uncharacterized protein n=1 Tax=Pycnococcus provasolii TaxID=41880 RepID=A0A830HLQ0_9CHLO|nr:hypothetical protein PPROV_000547400 [Pycnococcus provasolii]
MVSSTRATRRTVVTAADDLLALGGASRVSRAQGGTGASRVQTARRAAKRGRTVSSPSAACEEGARHDQAGKNTRGDGGNNDRNAINSPSDSTLGQTHAATAIVPSDDVLSLSAHGTAMAQPMTPPKNTKTGRPKKDKVPTPERKKHKKELDARRREESQVQLSTSTPMKPRTIAEVQDVSFTEGTSYTTRGRAEADVKATAERDGKLIYYGEGPNGNGRKDAQRLCARCVTKDCKFVVTFAGQQDGSFRCTSYEPHSCTTPPPINSKQKHHNYHPKELAPVLRCELDKNPGMKPRQALPLLKGYVHKTMKGNFAGKVIQAAKTLGTMDDEYSYIEPFAKMVNDSGIGTMTVQTVDAAEMKQIYVNRLRAEHDFAMKELHESQRTPFDEPSTDHITDEGGAYYAGFTYIPRYAVDMFNAGLLDKPGSKKCSGFNLNPVAVEASADAAMAAPDV